MKSTVKVTKTLADENRLRTLAALLDGKELCACHIIALLNLAPATVSRHMNLLVEAGLVTSRREGRWVHYRLSGAFPPALEEWLRDSWSGSEQVAMDSRDLDRIVACQRTELCASRRIAGTATRESDVMRERSRGNGGEAR